MEHTINDPNRSDRLGYLLVGVVMCCMSVTLTLVDSSMLPVTCIAAATSLLVCGMGRLGRPYAVLDQKGITYRLLVREKFCRWDEVMKVGIRNTKATKVPMEYLFAIVIVLPGPFKHAWMRDLFQSLVLPNRPEIRAFLDACYGPLDFDDADSLSDWQKRCYGFKKKQ